MSEIASAIGYTLLGLAFAVAMMRVYASFDALRKRLRGPRRPWDE